MYKLVFRSGGPAANAIRFVAIFVILVNIVFRVDLTKLIFKRTAEEMQGPQITERLSEQQVAEILALRSNPPAEQAAVVPVPEIIPEQMPVRQEPEQPPRDAFYRYTDDKGVFVIVDDLANVPARYRANMKVSAGNKIRTTAIVYRNNQILVPVTINYQGRSVSVYLQLDTGATNIIISPAIAQRLGIQPEQTTRGIATIADGSQVSTAIAQAGFVTVGQKTKQGVALHIMPRSGAEETGLLGMSFLADFPHTIDTKAQVIKWL